MVGDGHYFFRRGGFGMIEIALAAALAIVLAIIIAPSFLGRRSSMELDGASGQIAALLREAQSRSAAGDRGSSWGVHFENTTATRPFYALFRGVYGTSTVAGLYSLPSAVGFSTSTLGSGSSTEIVFARISGLPSASFKISMFLLSDSRRSSTVRVATSGAVSY